MTTAELLHQLTRLGINVSANGDRLVCEAPKGVLTPELQAELQAQKADILSFLTQVETASPSSWPRLQPTPRGGDIPLSPGQERLWQIEQLEPGRASYHIPAAFRLRGSLHVGALEQSLAEIVQRHEILRTTFVQGSEGPLQRIAPQGHVRLLKCVTLPPAEAGSETAVTAWLVQEAMRPFDLLQGPLCRATVCRLGPEDHLLLITMHHLVSDGWSFALFFRELEALYTAYVHGQPPFLEPHAIQYGDYAYWQQQWLQTPSADQQLAYWDKHLQGCNAAVELPVSPPQSGVCLEVQGAVHPVFIGAGLTAQLKQLSREAGSTLFMTLLAAFHALLHQYSRQDNILICSPVAGRHRAETETMLGFFNNLIVLRGDLSGNPSFRQLLSRIRQVVVDAYRHQDAPFQWVAELPHVKRFSLCRAAFDFQDAAGWSLNLPGLTASYVEVDTASADFDLALLMDADGDRLSGVWRYKTALFDARAIEALQADFEALLRMVVQAPGTRLTDLLPHPVRSTGQTAASISRVADRPEPPTDGLELKLQTIWARILDLDSVGRDDNFFALGGHSLLAVELTSAVTRQLGQQFPPSILLQAPTVRQLAQALRQHDDAHAWSSLVPIRTGEDPLPLFLIHAAGGNVFIYRELAKYLGPQQAVYGLQSQGLDGVQPLLTTIEDMAARYVREIQVVQPEGPYLLGGYCMGGTVAYEVAQQLARQGHEIALLALFETYNWANLRDRLKAAI